MFPFSLFSFLRRQQHTSKRHSKRPLASRRLLEIECLEDRVVPASIVQTQTFTGFTDFSSQPLAAALSQFNTLGGTRVLDSVEIEASSSVTSTLTGSATNNDLVNTATFTITVPNPLSATVPIISPLATSVSGLDISGLSMSVTTEPPIFSTTIPPSSTVNLPSAGVTMTLTNPTTNFFPTNLTPFIGTGTLANYVTSATASYAAQFGGTSNATYSLTDVSTGTASVTVIYTYHTSTNPPVTPGDTATIGYWHNKNGQGLIDSFNGGSSSTALGTWLATNFPNLFGSASDPVGNLAGKTNAQVAAAYLNDAFAHTGGVQDNTYVQTFAVALAVYATDPTLGGGAASMGQGFTVQPGGTGNATYNVGSNGAAFGVPNNTSLTVDQILQTLNTNYNPTTQLFYGGNTTLTNDANNVTNGINQGGDIK